MGRDVLGWDGKIWAVIRCDVLGRDGGTNNYILRLDGME